MRYLITLRLAPADATLKHAQTLLEPLGLSIDTRYGLVAISPKRSLFVVRVEGEVNEDALNALAEVVGVHGDIKIAPIGNTDGHDKGE